MLILAIVLFVFSLIFIKEIGWVPYGLAFGFLVVVGVLRLIEQLKEDQTESSREYRKTVVDAQRKKVAAMRAEAKTQFARKETVFWKGDFWDRYLDPERELPSFRSLRRRINKLDKKAERMWDKGFTFDVLSEKWVRVDGNVTEQERLDRLNATIDHMAKRQSEGLQSQIDQWDERAELLERHHKLMEQHGFMRDELTGKWVNLRTQKRRLKNDTHEK
jgi:hypothetical protein